MGLFGHHKEPSIVVNISNINICDKPEGPRYKLFVALFNQSKNTIMPLNLAANQQAPLVLGLIDTVTGLPVSATFANSAFTSDTPSVAKVDANNNLVAVAPGTFNITATTSETYTDSTGTVQTKTDTATGSGTISAVVTADGVQLVISLGAITTQTQTTPAS